MKVKTCRFLFALLFAITSSAGLAGDIFVTNLNDSGSGSLRQALVDAKNAPGLDTVKFSGALNGATIPLTGTQLFVDDADGVTVDALSLDNGLTVQGRSGVRAFENGGKLTLRGLTITGGALGPGFGGGAIYCNGLGTLTLDQCTVSGNSATLAAARCSTTAPQR